MKTNIIDHAEAVSAKTGTKTRPRWPALLLLLLSVAMGAGGCTDYYGGYYGASPGYGPGPYYGGYGRGYGGGYGGYGGYPGGVTIAVGDRPYYTRGPGYWAGRTYYVWRPGHWAWRNGVRFWVRGHYVVRG
jgi:hypothetical protein